MISFIKVENFYSVGKAQELSFEIAAKDKLDNSAIQISERFINLINCIVGHNASGKTTILKAIAFLFWLLNDSYTAMSADEKIPVEPHKLHEKEPIRIEIELLNQGTLFKYKVELDRNQIYQEYLGEKIVRGYTKIFEYTRSKDAWDFKAPKIKINKNDLARFKERKNVSVLSSLLETGYLPELNFIRRFQTNVSNMGHVAYPVMGFGVSKTLYEDPLLQKDALRFIEKIDVGISGFEFAEAIRMKAGKQLDETEKKHILEYIHESKAGKFKLPWFNESNGTRHSLHHITKILPILKTGGIVVLDEIDSGLHPYVAKKIISLFEDKETNLHNAQLIFSTHQHLLLNDRTKTQIFIAEKENKKCETEIFRLDEIEGIRNDENYFQKYLAGSYGGVADISRV